MKYTYILICFLIISCDQNKNVQKKETVEKIDELFTYDYRHYFSRDTHEISHLDSMGYSFSYINDSTILLKRYPEGDTMVSVIDCDDKENYFPYYPYVLNLKKYCKSEVTVRGDHLNNYEYYFLHFEKKYLVNGDSMKIMFFYKDNLIVDDGNMIYFSDKVGVIASYNSWGTLKLYENKQDENNERLRKLLFQELLIDTTSFPYPPSNVFSPR